MLSTPQYQAADSGRAARGCRRRSWQRRRHATAEAVRGESANWLNMVSADSGIPAPMPAQSARESGPSPPRRGGGHGAAQHIRLARGKAAHGHGHADHLLLNNHAQRLRPGSAPVACTAPARAPAAAGKRCTMLPCSGPGRISATSTARSLNTRSASAPALVAGRATRPERCLPCRRGRGRHRPRGRPGDASRLIVDTLRSR